MRTRAFLLNFIIILSFVLYNSVTAFAAYKPEFEVRSKAVLLQNITTGDTIFEQNSTGKIYPASLTKIMTAIIVLEKIPDLDAVQISLKRYINDMLYGKNAQLGGILVGQTYTARELMYAMLVQSANEAALMLADYVGDGSINYFCELMNNKAKELGCKNTHFASPNGLHDENNYSTAQDFAIITKYAMSLPQFMDIANTTSYTAAETAGHPKITWVTTNSTIVKSSKYYYSPISGIKTGYIEETGRCLISSATKDGYTYLLVLIGAPEDSSGDNLAFIESKKIYEWAFKSFKVKTIIEKGRNIQEVPLRLAANKDYLQVMVGERYTYLMPVDLDPSSVQRKIVLPDYINAPVKKEQEVGWVELYLAGEEIGKVPLLSAETVERSEIAYYIDLAMRTMRSFWFKLIASLILVLIVAYAVLTAVRYRNNRVYGAKNAAARRIRHRKI